MIWAPVALKIQKSDSGVVLNAKELKIKMLYWPSGSVNNRLRVFKYQSAEVQAVDGKIKMETTAQI